MLGLGLAGGLSYTLPRLLGGNQPLALCLALTGMALEGPDLLFTQVATNYMTHRKLDMMMERLAEVRHRCLGPHLDRGDIVILAPPPACPQVAQLVLYCLLTLLRCTPGCTSAASPPAVLSSTD